MRLPPIFPLLKTETLNHLESESYSIVWLGPGNEVRMRLYHAFYALCALMMVSVLGEVENNF